MAARCRPIVVCLCCLDIEQGLNFADTLAACLHDKCDPLRTRHSHFSMIRSRLLAIACGHEDCDDHDQLRRDPAFRMACERLPDTGRFATDLVAAGEHAHRGGNWRAWPLIELFCSSFRTVPGHIVLDIDNTTDRTQWRPVIAIVHHARRRLLFPADPNRR